MTNRKKLEIQMEIINILVDFTNDNILSEDIAEDIMIVLQDKLK